MRPILRVASLAALVVAAGCAESGFRVTDDGFILPASLEEVLPMAESIAVDWDPDAYLWGMGGAFTITDREGRAFNHSYRFYSMRTRNRLDLHFFGGAPWGEEEFKWPPPTPYSVNVPGIGSAEAVQIAVDYAEALRIDVPETLTARYLAFPVWPEPPVPPGVDPVLAWRVDFLEMRPFQTDPDLPPDETWWSLVTAYIHPVTGDSLEIKRVPRIYPDFSDPVPPNR